MQFSCHRRGIRIKLFLLGFRTNLEVRMGIAGVHASPWCTVSVQRPPQPPRLVAAGQKRYRRPMKILVTGSAGRVGRAVFVRLALEHEVLGLDRSPASTVQFTGDVGDARLLRQALRGVDAIVHVAALHAPHVGFADAAEFERINVAATRLLGELAADAGICRFVFTSTTALYGTAVTPAARAGWVDESLAPRPRTIYHETKLEAERLLEELVVGGTAGGAAGSGLCVTALRMSRCFPEPAPRMAVYRLHRGVDARDVAEAHVLALSDQRPGFRRYVISGATPFRREDAEQLFDDAAGVIHNRAPRLAEAFARRGWSLPDSIDRVCDPGLAMKELGWRPRFGFEEVLKMLDEGSSEVLPPERPG
jgi:UDP-glucose 4-epimerase